MKNTLPRLTCLLILCLTTWAWAQVSTAYFPDVPGYETLMCDFHMHTVFSDGSVWPNIRVGEAWREGLDSIAITDHIEYQPHKKDLPTNHNRPYEVARGNALEYDILLVKATEVTRETPPGHYNALFLNDINPVDTEEFLDAIEAANQQKAFVFWNHHTWKGAAKGQWEAVQTKMYENKWLHGMEVANGGSYYPLAHAWCLEKGLTMMGNSDMHGPSYDSTYTAGKHRSLTLVFVKDRSVKGIREALFAGRTAVWWKNQVIGRKEFLQPLFQSCITVHPPHFRKKNTVYMIVENTALVDMELVRISGKGPSNLTIPARSKVLAKVTAEPGSVTRLSYEIRNFLIAPEKYLTVDWQISERIAIQ